MAIPIAKLADILDLNDKIYVADIGAAAIAEDPIYKNLVSTGFGHLYAFDGDIRQIEKVEESFGSNSSVFNYFLGDGYEHIAYICSEASGMTSILKPKKEALKFFNGFSQFGEVIRKEKVKTYKLNDVHEIDKIHFLKMDIQGAELSVLMHGKDKLSDCVAIQLEVSYICLYEDQPTFGDIDVWLRKFGFVPHCFLDIKRWSITPIVNNNNFRKPFNQLLESDVIYIRDPLKLNSCSVEQVKSLGFLADNLFNSPDLAVYCLLDLIKREVFSSEIISVYRDAYRGDIPANLENFNERMHYFQKKCSDVDYKEPLKTKNLRDELHSDLIDKGTKSLENSDFLFAEKQFLQILQENPISEEALYGLVLCSRNRNDSLKACEYISELLRLNPNHSEALNQFGLIMVEQQKLSDARKAFIAAIEITPEYVEVQRNLADTGVQTYLTILKNHPEDIPSLLRMAELNREVENTQEASEWAKLVLQIEPENTIANQIINL